MIETEHGIFPFSLLKILPCISNQLKLGSSSETYVSYEIKQIIQYYKKLVRLAFIVFDTRISTYECAILYSQYVRNTILQ